MSARDPIGVRCETCGAKSGDPCIEFGVMGYSRCAGFHAARARAAEHDEKGKENERG